MGLFSWDCKACEHPMLSIYAIDKTNGWMLRVVVLTKEGEVLVGAYDGYGRVDDHDICARLADEPECYHAACWRLAGKPRAYTSGSRSSSDQGFFFEGKHSFPEPKSKADIRKMKAAPTPGH